MIRLVAISQLFLALNTWLLANSNKRCFAAAMSTSSAGTRKIIDRRIQVLYSGHPDRYRDYRVHLADAFTKAGLSNVQLVDANTDEKGTKDPGCFDYIIYSPHGPIDTFTAFCSPGSALKAVLNLQAGVDGICHNPTLPVHVPLTRLVDPGLNDGMVEYVVGNVLRHHLCTDRFQDRQRRRVWEPELIPLASQRTVGILGMGALGGACAGALAALKFNVVGWSRTDKQRPLDLERIALYHGPKGLEQVLQRSEFLVLLLPNTPETKHILRKETLAKCQTGVVIINVGRGSLIHETDLLYALNSGKVSGATLDVFEEEPLPLEHAFWEHPCVYITPHIAAKT